jgi:hypothetical protein
MSSVCIAMLRRLFALNRVPSRTSALQRVYNVISFRCLHYYRRPNFPKNHRQLVIFSTCHVTVWYTFSNNCGEYFIPFYAPITLDRFRSANRSPLSRGCDIKIWYVYILIYNSGGKKRFDGKSYGVSAYIYTSARADDAPVFVY